MRRLFLFLLFINPLSFSFVNADEPSPVSSLTLGQSIDLATTQSEQLQTAQENQVQAEQRRKEALGSVLPNVHWIWSRLWQDETNASGPLNRSHFTQSRFTATQPVFKGLKEFSTMSAYKAQAREFESQLRRQTVLLSLDVAQAFYQVVQFETNGHDLDTLLSLAVDRVKDLHSRVRLGKSREGDIISQESQVATLRANRESNAGNIVAARDELGFLVNRNVRATVLIDSMTIPSPLPDEKYYLALAPKRSDVVALEDDVMFFRYGIRVAQSGYSPFVDLVGNYYTQRIGVQSDIKWDLALDLDVPLFQGGAVTAQVEEARSLLRQSELALRREKRLANSEISQAYAMLDSSIRQVDAYEEAAKKAKQSYDAQTRDYRYGLVDNLQVLESMNNMLTAIVSYDTAVVQSKLNYLRLKYVTEDLP